MRRVPCVVLALGDIEHVLDELAIEGRVEQDSVHLRREVRVQIGECVAVRVSR